MFLIIIISSWMLAVVNFRGPAWVRCEITGNRAHTHTHRSCRINDESDKECKQMQLCVYNLHPSIQATTSCFFEKLSRRFQIRTTPLSIIEPHQFLQSTHER